jgi:hypothetical protein
LTKNLSIFKYFKALGNMIRDVYSGSFVSRIQISDSGVKKALDPGSESAKLLPTPLK